MIPQIVDTVVHVDGGDVKKVFDVELTVKTRPAWNREIWPDP